MDGVPDALMTFNASTGVWTITRDMPAGKFKFRANGDWGINFGDNGADFKPEYDGADIVILLSPAIIQFHLT